MDVFDVSFVNLCFPGVKGLVYLTNDSHHYMDVIVRLLLNSSGNLSIGERYNHES